MKFKSTGNRSGFLKITRSGDKNHITFLLDGDGFNIENKEISGKMWVYIERDNIDNLINYLKTLK